MAFVVNNRSGAWEIRESRATANGPRARTLASFKSLDHRHIALAIERSENEVDAAAVIRAARKAGAPVALPAVDQAAIELLRAIGDGATLSPGLRRIISDAVSAGANSDETNEALSHVGKSPATRGAELIDLLLLTDAIPRRESWSKLEFPGIPATGA